MTIKTTDTKKPAIFSAIVDGSEIEVKTVRKCVSDQIVDAPKCKGCLKQSPDVFKVCAVLTAEKAKIEAERIAEEKKAKKEKERIAGLSPEELEMLEMEKAMTAMKAMIEEKKAAIKEKKETAEMEKAKKEKERIDNLANDVCFGIDDILNGVDFELTNLEKIKKIALAINESGILKIEKKRVVKSGTTTRKSSNGTVNEKMLVTLKALHEDNETIQQAADTLQNSEVGAGMSDAAAKKFVQNANWALNSKLGKSKAGSYGDKYFTAIENGMPEPDGAGPATMNVFRNLQKAWVALGY